MVCGEEMYQVMVHRTGVVLGSVTLNKVLLVDSGLSDPGIRKVSTSSPSGMGHRESNGS